MTREEAINKVREMNLPKETMEILEALAPELKDSEDERIRKEAISIVQSYMNICDKEGDPCLSGYQVLAWLDEKQKDHGILNTDALEKWLIENVSKFINRKFNEFHRQLEYDGTIDIDALISDMRKQNFYKKHYGLL